MKNWVWAFNTFRKQLQQVVHNFLFLFQILGECCKAVSLSHFPFWIKCSFSYGWFVYLWAHLDNCDAYVPGEFRTRRLLKPQSQLCNDTLGEEEAHDTRRCARDHIWAERGCRQRSSSNICYVRMNHSGTMCVHQGHFVNMQQLYL